MSALATTGWIGRAGPRPRNGEQCMVTLVLDGRQYLHRATYSTGARDGKGELRQGWMITSAEPHLFSEWLVQYWLPMPLPDAQGRVLIPDPPLLTARGTWLVPPALLDAGTFMFAPGAGKTR